MNTQQTMIEEGNLVSHKVKLMVMTPVFIGGGEDSHLARTQYILDTDHNMIHILNEKKWAEFIQGKNHYRQNWFNDYLEFISRHSKALQRGRKGQRPPRYSNALFEWLKEKKLVYRDYSHCIRYTLKSPQVERGHDIHCFIKNTDYKPYIPGTSIKGAIRTAVLFAAIKDKDEHFRRKYWTRIINEINDDRKKFGQIKRSLGYIENDLEEELLRTIFYPKQKGRNNAVNDIFKGLYVSDSSPIEPGLLQVLQKLDLSTYEKNRSHLKHLPIYREYLSSQTTTDFTLTLDRNIVKGTLLESWESILDCLDTFATHLFDEEKGLYSKFNVLKEKHMFYYPYEVRFDVPEEEYPWPNLCLSGGTGFQTKTIIHALAPDMEQANKFIRKYLDQSFYKHKHYHNDTLISPRTLKRAQTDNINLITGWCNIQEA